MSTEWHDKEALEYVRERAAQFIEEACWKVEGRAKELLNVPGTAKSIKKGSKGEGIYGAVRSKPGEPPRKQTGVLRISVTHEVDKASLVGRVGTNLDYGKYLELGTKRGILPRPWLRRSLDEMKADVDSLLKQIKD